MIKVKSLEKDILTYFSAKIVPGMAGIISVPVFVRLFGEKSYGEFSLLLNFLLLLVTVSTGWLVQGILRYNQEFQTNDTFREQVFVVSIKLTSIIALLAFLVLLFLGYLNPIFLLVISAFLFLAALYNVSFAIQQSNMESRKVAISESFRAVVFIILPCFLVMIDPLLALFLGVMASYYVALFVLDKQTFTYPSRSLASIMNLTSRGTHAKPIIQKLWQYGWPLTLWFFMATLLNISDRYVVEYYCGIQEAGEYSAVYDLVSKGIKLLYAPLLMAAFPALVKHKNNKKYKLGKGLLYKTIIYGAVFFVISFFFLLTFKDFLIKSIFEFSNYGPAESLIIPIFLGVSLWQFALILHKPLELSGETINMAKAVFAALILNVILNFIFVPVYGYVAAAYTTIIGSAIYVFLVWRMARK